MSTVLESPTSSSELSPEAIAAILEKLDPSVFLESLEPAQVQAKIDQLQIEAKKLDRQIRAYKTILKAKAARTRGFGKHRRKAANNGNGAPDEEPEAEPAEPEAETPEPAAEPASAPKTPAAPPSPAGSREIMRQPPRAVRTKLHTTGEEDLRLKIYDFLRVNGQRPIKAIAAEISVSTGEAVRLLNCTWFTDCGAGEFACEPQA